MQGDPFYSSSLNCISFRWLRLFAVSLQVVPRTTIKVYNYKQAYSSTEITEFYFMLACEPV